MQVVALLFPFLGFFVSNLCGVLMGGINCGYLTMLLVSFSFNLSCFSFYSLLCEYTFNTYFLFEWICSDFLKINWFFKFDCLTLVMLIVVTFISTLVHLYSIDYMEHDPHLVRFMSFLSLFTFLMLILVTANNFIQMFVGWEGVGLSSYFLINFWFTRIQANKAAIKAMLVNRVGDFFLLIGVFSIFFNYATFDYNSISYLVNIQKDFKEIFIIWEINALDFSCLFLFLGCMGKSAQLGLHTWLPDAMEGPTPVSALIHAATMVTAGVFLLIQCSFLLEFSFFTRSLIVLIGSVTCFFAGSIGLFQYDIKKVIAYSTCSQLGYMIFSCGLSAYDIAFFHLTNHAAFKALLFLGAGSVIHSLGGEQDMRKMGGLVDYLPFSCYVMLIGSLALCGFPYLSGFYSKDLILEFAMSKYSISSNFSSILGLVSAFLTSFYSVRVFYMVFFGKFNGNSINYTNVHEGAWRTLFPLLILSFLSVLLGFYFKFLFVGFGTNFWNSAIFVLPNNYRGIDFEILDNSRKNIPFILSFLAGFFVFYIYEYKIVDFFFFKLTKTFKNINTFLNKKWFFDRLYNLVLVKFILEISHKYIYVIIDRGFLEFYGPSGIVTFFKRANVLGIEHTGSILTYINYSSSITILMITLAFSYQLDSIIFFEPFIFLILILIFFFLLKEINFSK